jgi:hypothetical protein
MKNGMTLMLMLSLTIVRDGASPAQELPDGPYFGQAPPGRTPEIFAEGFVSKQGSIELHPRFSADGTEFLYMSAGGDDSSKQARFRAIHLIRKDDKWRSSDIRILAGRDDASGAQYSPDGRIISFLVPQSGESEYMTDIFVRYQVRGAWSDPAPLPGPINTEHREASHSFTNDGTLYFVSNNRLLRKTGRRTRGDVYRAPRVTGGYPAVQRMPFSTDHDEECVYAAPDDSYIIFCSWRPAGKGMHDLYISFHNDNDTWTDPRILEGDINTSGNEIMPFVTGDGLYLFFTRSTEGESDIYWVKATFIDEMRKSAGDAPKKE